MHIKPTNIKKRNFFVAGKAHLTTRLKRTDNLIKNPLELAH